MDKPDVESIEGLSPAIAIEQRTASHNPRSTVGTVTEIYDHLRLLFARIGVPHCYRCGKAIKSQTIDLMLETILAYPANARITVLAPMTSFTLIVVNDGRSFLGTLDVCHSATPALSANGEMPCVGLSPCTAPPTLTVSFSEPPLGA
jgi:hypothetical protein